ncbi:MAG: M20/M25/M40 family metallo-hydrolase [Patescibacteria group bacterium]
MIDKKILTKTFFDLVKIDSPSGQEKKISSYLLRKFLSLGLSPHLDKQRNVFVKVPGQGFPLLLSAHMDTVEPGRNIRPIIKNGIIKSDGTTILGADNKAAVAVLVEILKYLHAKKLNHRSLEIVFTASEEVANLGAANLDYGGVLAKEGYIFDNPNPIGTIISGSPFYNRFDISISGKSTHSSKPQDGINVIPIFIHAMRDINLGKVSENTLVNIGVVRSGHVRNSVPGEMIIEGEVRSFLEKEVKEYSQNIIKTFFLVSKKHDAKIKTSVVRENSGYLYSQKDPFIKKTQDIMRDLRINPVLKKIWGCSDANIFLEKGIKVLNLGNGSKDTHTTRESISIDDLFKLSNLIFSIVAY